MGKSTIETIHEVRLKQFCARLREGLSRPVNPQELKTSRWRRRVPAALFLFRPAEDAQRVPRSPLLPRCRLKLGNLFQSDGEQFDGLIASAAGLDGLDCLPEYLFGLGL